MNRVKTFAMTGAAVAALGFGATGDAARGGDPDPAQARAVREIERRGGWVCPEAPFFAEGVVVALGRKATDEDLVHLQYLSRMQILAIEHTEVTGAGLAHLKDLKSLKVLSLEDSPITDAGLAHLEGVKHLRELDLNGTQITDAGIDHLKEMKHLRKLSVTKTGISAEGIKELRRSLRWCQIR